MKEKWKKFLDKTQEFTLWLPGLVILTVLGYVLLGGVSKVGPDAISWLAELPAKCAYSVAILGIAWLILNLYTPDLDRDELKQLYLEALSGNGAAMKLLVIRSVMVVAALAISLSAFVLVK